jgi:hypothetical protein
MTPEELADRFVYHAVKPEQVEIYTKLRAKAKEFAELTEAVVPESREKSLSFTHLEQAIMWANAAVARRS